MSKSYKLVGLERPAPSTSQHPVQTNWKLCIICQEDKAEALTCPSQSKGQDMRSGYSSVQIQRILSNSMSLDNFQENLSWKDSMTAISLKQPRLLAMLSIIMNAGSDTTIQNCKEQKKPSIKTEGDNHDVPMACKRTRSYLCSSTTENMAQEACFFFWDRRYSSNSDISNGQPRAGLCSPS